MGDPFTSYDSWKLDYPSDWDNESKCSNCGSIEIELQEDENDIEVCMECDQSWEV